MEIFYKRLTELRKSRYISQRDIAKFLQISQPSYIRYEHGTAEPTLENLSKIAKFFEVSTDYLLGLSDFWTKKTTRLSAV